MSLLAITTLAATAGAAFPLLFDRMGLDPALMSTPFITTCTDVAGTLIYLKTAEWLLVNPPQLLRPQVFHPTAPAWFPEPLRFLGVRFTPKKRHGSRRCHCFKTRHCCPRRQC